MLDYDIRKMYEEMEIRLIKSMKRNLQLHLDEEDETGFKYPQWQAMKLKELKRYQRQNKDIVGHDTKGFSSLISKYLKRELREGSYNALKEYRDAMGDKYKANKRLSNSFFRINDRKVNTLIKSVNNDLTTANKAVLRMTNDQYRKVIFQSQMYVANGVMTPKQAIDAANKDFLRRGLNVIEYKDGKRVNIASYSQMAVRTAGTRAMLMGEGAFRKKYKQHLIRISAHGTSCELCIPWQGKVLIDDVYGGGSSKDGKYPLLSEAMEQGLFHPNCRHGHSTYLGNKDDISDIKASFKNGKDGHESDAQYEDDMNYINRKIQEYRRLEVGSLDETNVKKYAKEKRRYQRKLIKLKNVPKTINALHITSNTKNALAIVSDGFNKDKMKFGAFGRAIYGTNNDDVIEYYKISKGDKGIIELDFDVTDYKTFTLNKITKSREQLYKELISQTTEEMTKEYKALYSEYKKRINKFNKLSPKDIEEEEKLFVELKLNDDIFDNPNAVAFIKVMTKHGYKGMILEQNITRFDKRNIHRIDENYYKKYKKIIDGYTGGSQIVAWDFNTVKIRRKI